jgi:hypothetical protein
VSPVASLRTQASRRTAVVRVTHWITAIAFLALLVSGIEVLVSHPRFYWGEVGNALTPPLFQVPIPSSRSTVPTGYGYVLPDQNGWSRYLHFEAAWVSMANSTMLRKSAIRYARPQGEERAFQRFERSSSLSASVIGLVWDNLAGLAGADPRATIRCSRARAPRRRQRLVPTPTKSQQPRL